MRDKVRSFETGVDHTLNDLVRRVLSDSNLF